MAIHPTRVVIKLPSCGFPKSDEVVKTYIFGHSYRVRLPSKRRLVNYGGVLSKNYFRSY